MDLFERNVPEITSILQQKVIGLAGCGGLGSNIAISLIRAGVKNLIMADFDRVELSNLNRQHFFRDDIGEFKVYALKRHLLNINPNLNLTIINKKLEPQDIVQLFNKSDLMIEAFDDAKNKKWLIEEWATNFPNKPIISGNGISGYGKTQELKVRKLGNIYLCGDGQTDSNQGSCSARIALVANMEANTAIELLMK